MPTVPTHLVHPYSTIAIPTGQVFLSTPFIMSTRKEGMEREWNQGWNGIGMRNDKKLSPLFIIAKKGGWGESVPFSLPEGLGYFWLASNSAILASFTLAVIFDTALGFFDCTGLRVSLIGV